MKTRLPILSLMLAASVASWFVASSSRARQVNREYFSREFDANFDFPKGFVESHGYRTTGSELGETYNEPPSRDIWCAGLLAASPDQSLRLDAGVRLYDSFYHHRFDWYQQVKPPFEYDSLPSGIAAGVGVVRYGWHSGLEINVNSSREACTVRVDYLAPTGTDPFRKASYDFSNDLGWLERLSREMLSRGVGRRLAPLESSGPVKEFQCQITWVKFYDLADWAKDRGYSLSQPDELPGVTMTKLGQAVYVPLGAMSVRRGGQWRDLGDCIAYKSERWLVPQSIDAALR